MILRMTLFLARPNGPRLSCGALEEEGVIQYPTRAASFKRLLGGRPWRPQLNSGRPGLRASQILGILQRTWCRVLLEIRPIHGIPQAAGPDSDGEDRNGTIARLDEASWVCEEGPVPTSSLDAPRPHEDPALDYDHPNADEPMRRSGSDPEALAIAQSRDDVS